MLWFDVEQRYNSIEWKSYRTDLELWFDVEQRYNSIRYRRKAEEISCGLM